jgi:hypothetical protein
MQELLQMEELTAISSLASTLFRKQELMYVRFYLRATNACTHIYEIAEKNGLQREIGFFALLLRINDFFPEEEEEEG